uniref:Uncharacterized protein n=1 Tax=Rhizophora mucronata TaxID=61149 RepID=A0A2P2P9U6_RHIMU
MIKTRSNIAKFQNLIQMWPQKIDLSKS